MPGLHYPLGTTVDLLLVRSVSHVVYVPVLYPRSYHPRSLSFLVLVDLTIHDLPLHSLDPGRPFLTLRVKVRLTALVGDVS